jgi:histidinol-phosphate phosphatase family protein
MEMKAVFLDRDGVINEYPGDADYVKSWEEFRFLPPAKPALKKLTESGIPIFIISNQAGVSKGIYSQKALDTITDNMLRELRDCGINIRGVFYCTHRNEDNCSCRKPRTGLIDAAIAQLEKKGRRIKLSEGFLVGDTIRDIETGQAAGLKTILVFSGKEKLENKINWQIRPDFTATDLLGAVEIILAK